MALQMFILAYVVGCAVIALSTRRAGGPKTLRGRLRARAGGLLLLPVALLGFGIDEGHRELAVLAVVAAGIAVAVVPAVAEKTVPWAMLGLVLFGLVLAGMYTAEFGAPTLYGAVLAGPGSWRTNLILPQAMVFLAASLWLFSRTADPRSRVARALFTEAVSPAGRRRPRLSVLLLVVLGLAIQLAGTYAWFGLRSWDTQTTALIVLLAALLVMVAPAAAADVAVIGLAGFGLYGIYLALYWPMVTMPEASLLASRWGFGPVVFYGVLQVTGIWGAQLAGLQGLLFLGTALWLVPRSIIPHVKSMLASDAELAARAQGLAQRVQRLTETRTDAVDTAVAELRRIERDLHDGAQARLVALGMSLRAAERLMPTNPEAALALVTEAKETSSKALGDLRGLVRGIHPPVLADRGLGDAVRALALDTPIRTDVDIDLPGRPEPPVEAAVYFAVAEAMTNAVKHSGARLVQIRVRYADGLLRAEVTDDGAGGAHHGAGAAPGTGTGTGLDGVEKRLATFDGVLAVSSPPGGPTIIAIEVPCVLSSPKTSSC
jgi:signal transduction histidine kinase